MCMNSHPGAITHSTPSHPSAGQISNSLSLSHPLSQFPANSHSFHPFLIPHGVPLPSYSPLPLPCARIPAGFSSNYFPVFFYGPFEKSGEHPSRDPQALQFPNRFPVLHPFIEHHNQSSENAHLHDRVMTHHSTATFNVSGSCNPSVFPHYNVYPYCPNLLFNPQTPTLPNVCCVNVSTTPLERETAIDSNPFRNPSPFSQNSFVPPNERCSFTPPRISHGMKRTSSHLSLSSSTPSPPNSPKGSSCSRIHIQPHRNYKNKVKPPSIHKANSTPSLNHTNAQNQSITCQEITFSRINKPPALVIARQRLPSREIPDVLSPNTPNLVSPSGHLHLNLK